MREILDKLDEYEERMSDSLFDSATVESEADSPIKVTQQESNEEVVYLLGTRKGTVQLVTLRKTGRKKVDSEVSAKAVNSTEQKRIEIVMDMGQDDDRLPGTSRTMTNVKIVPPILVAGLRSASYKTKRSDRTLTGATLEMEILSQCGESALRDFRPSCMNKGKGGVIGQLTPLEYNRLTVSDTYRLRNPPVDTWK